MFLMENRLFEATRKLPVWVPCLYWLPQPSRQNLNRGEDLSVAFLEEGEASTAVVLRMAYQFSRKGCFKCGNLGHIAENCSSDQRLCYNCRQPGHESSACPSPRTVAAKQCYSCGGVGHIQAECPSLRVQQQGGNQKCYNCGRFGHIARTCPSGTLGAGFASRAPPPGRALNTSTLPPVKCYRCGGPNHMARDCLAAPGTGSILDNTPTGPAAGNPNKNKTCYKCQQEGHIARECPENTDFVG
ncbi:putative zinc knuckle protein [Lyophyllum shimeji]|uniref:Zinc knuckle protein n=1 Tax=Lyophyllum shimeji TaxID=47721 RepID=A0A9P3PDB8_LYOSH|nr:putative zinc knuckle protein [Lyophyllum shimeji]